MGFSTLDESELEELILSICYLSASDWMLHEVMKALFESEESNEIFMDESRYTEIDEVSIDDDDFHDNDYDDYYAEDYGEGYDQLNNEEFDDHQNEEYVESNEFVTETCSDNLPSVALLRVPFRERFSKIINEFDNIDEKDPNFFQAIENLRIKVQSVVKAEKATKSSRILLQQMLDMSLDWNSDLLLIAVLTLFYSKIGSSQLYEILYAILPEFRSHQKNTDHHLNMLCPAQAITRNNAKGEEVTFPSIELVQHVHDMCEKRHIIEKLPSLLVDVVEEIESESNGYFQLFDVIERNDDDALVDIMSSLADPVVEAEKVKELREKVSEANDRIRDLRSERSNLMDSIKGGADLYPFSGGICVSFISGEYRFSVCPGGEVTQHKKNVSQADRGIRLGRYKSHEKDPTSGKLIMSFRDGENCWNAPARSATVYISCGTNNEILTAAEPETCVYEFTMQSTIACNNEYAREHKIKLR